MDDRAAQAVQPPQRRGDAPRQALRHLGQRALERQDLRIDPQRARVGHRPRRLALGLGAAGAGLPVHRLAAAPRPAAVPLVGQLDVPLDPHVGLGQQLERAVVGHAQVRGDHLAARLADLEAVVEVVPVAHDERLVEADGPHGPRGQHQEQAVDRVDLAERRDGTGPGVSGHLPAAVLVVAVGDRRAAHLALPPRDRADVPGTGRARDRHVRVAQRLAHRGAEAGAGDLGAWVHDHERLEVVMARDGCRAAGCSRGRCCRRPRTRAPRSPARRRAGCPAAANRR